MQTNVNKKKIVKLCCHTLENVYLLSSFQRRRRQQHVSNCEEEEEKKKKKRQKLATTHEIYTCFFVHTAHSTTHKEQ